MENTSVGSITGLVYAILLKIEKEKGINWNNSAVTVGYSMIGSILASLYEKDEKLFHTIFRGFLIGLGSGVAAEIKNLYTLLATDLTTKSQKLDPGHVEDVYRMERLIGRLGLKGAECIAMSLILSKLLIPYINNDDTPGKNPSQSTKKK